MGTILMSALVAHTAWHWAAERGSVLLDFRMPEFTLADIAAQVGKDRSSVANTLRLLALSPFLALRFNLVLVGAILFGLLIGLSGCLRGMQAERSAAGVGQAATTAVVVPSVWSERPAITPNDRARSGIVRRLASATGAG